jgi:hypothetical protein
MNDYFRVFGTARNALVAVHFGFWAVFLLVAAPLFLRNGSGGVSAARAG